MRFAIFAPVLAVALSAHSCKSDGGDSNDTANSKAPETGAPGTTGITAATGATAATGTGTTPGTASTSTVGTIGVAGDLSDAFPRGLSIDALQPIVSVPVDANLFSRVGDVGVQALALAPVPPPNDGGMNPPNVGPMNPPNQPPPVAAAPQSLTETLAAQDALLAGTADKCLDPMALQPAVFNPPSGDTCMNDGQLRYPNGGTGEPTTEACVVITSRREVDRARQLLDAATKLSLALLCQAKKTAPEATLPAIGKTLDLKDALVAAAAASGAPNTTVDYARITRLADDGGKPVYRTDVKLMSQAPNGYAGKELHLVHSPTDDATDAYRGIIWMTQTSNPNEGAQADANGRPIWFGVSYVKNGTVAAPRLKFDLRRFSWAGNESPLTASGLLDLSAGADFSRPDNDPQHGMFPGVAPSQDSHNAVITNISYLNFDVNPLDGEGSISVWANDGNYRTSGRGLVTRFERGDDGKFQGCGIAGKAEEGLSVRASLHTGSPLNLPVEATIQVSEGLRDHMGAQLGNVDACTAAVKTSAEANRSGQCYLKANDGIYDDQDQLVLAAPGCVSLKVLAEDQLTAGVCEIRFRGENADYVYLQCFKQNTAGLYEISFPDGSTDLIKTPTATEAGAAPFDVSAPDLAEVVEFTQDVRPTAE